jgi:hypothetical protein
MAITAGKQPKPNSHAVRDATLKTQIQKVFTSVVRPTARLVQDFTASRANETWVINSPTSFTPSLVRSMRGSGT